MVSITPGFVYPSSTFTYPRDGATSIDTTAAFTWTTFPEAQAYQLLIGTTSQGHDLLNSGPLPFSQSSYRVSALPVGQTLYATLLVSGGGYWVEGPTATFTAAARPPGFIFPLDGQVSVDPTKGFSWTADTRAQAYYLLVGTTIYGANLVNTGALPSTRTSFSMPVLPANSTLYATLFTKINGAWSHYVAATFTTGPVRATLIDPYDGDTALDGAPLFSWTTIAGADGYLLTIGTTPYGSNLDSTALLAPSTTSIQLLNLPAIQTLYATLYTRIHGQWSYQEIAFNTV